jgi:uncharacterized protein
MSGMLMLDSTGAVLGFLAAWVGHACIWVTLLNSLYGQALPKRLLKPWRLLTGLVILGFPLIVWLVGSQPIPLDGIGPPEAPPLGAGATIAIAYLGLCFVFGGFVFPIITIARLLRETPACLIAESTRTLDLWPELGHKLIGNGHFAWMTRLPGNCVFRIDFTDLTLALPELPLELDGLTILMLSDLHFHGTPARPYFDRIIDELTAAPVPDLVCLIGDYVDSDTHHEWIAPILGRLTATGAKFAILGNHDEHHDPAKLRGELAATGYTVLGNTWQLATIRGVSCVVMGHEGPRFAPAPDLAAAPPGLFRLCLSHTPDNFYWGIANRINLMLCGHVHCGAIRLPVIGPIFVPSIYGRRFDSGVFFKNGTAMVVSRGVSGKEPLRFRCNPQVIRVKLVCKKPG